MENIENSENRASFSPSRPVSSRLSYASILSKSKSDDVVDSCLNSAPINKLASADESLNSTSIDRSESAEESFISTSIDKSDSAAEGILNSTSIDKSASTDEESSSCKEESIEPEVEVLNFSSNDEIDRILHGQERLEIVGYVDNIEYDASAIDPKFRRSTFYKIVVNNGYGRRVQVTAWDDLCANIFKIDRLYTLVHLRNLTAQPVEKIYNLGEVDFELLVQSDTKFTTYGRYKAPEVYLCGFIDALNKAGSEIRIECYIRSPLRRCEDAASEPCFMSSITDGVYMMNLRLPADADQLNLEVGQAVSVIGVVIDENNKPAKFYVETLDDVRRIPDRKNMPLIFVYLGNKYPKRVL